MIIPEHIILELLQEAWPKNEVKIFQIVPNNNLPNYFQVHYAVKNASDDWVLTSVSYSYHLHILPKMEKWRESRINYLVD